MPQPRRHGGHHHQPNRHQGAQGLKTGHQVEHHQHQKALLPAPAAALQRAQKLRVEAFQHQAAVAASQRQQAQAGHAGHQVQASLIHAERAAKQDVQHIEPRAMVRNQGHAQRQRRQVQGGQAGVLAQRRQAADQAGQPDHQQAGQHAAECHRRQREAEEHEAQCHPGQDGVAQRVAQQAHAAQRQEHAQRCRAQCQRQGRRQCPPHEGKLGERCQQQLVGQWRQ